MQTIGETRDAMSMGLIHQIEDFANNMKHILHPFYIVFHAKADKISGNAIRQAIKAYTFVPKGMLGMLIWYVDNSKGIMDFRPDLSSPPDIPVDPSLLSEKSSDFCPRVAEKGKQLNVLAS